MKITSLPGSKTDRSNPGTLLAAVAYARYNFGQPANDEIQRDVPERRATGHSPRKSCSTLYGLLCASCKAYYASDLAACPICSFAERVPARGPGG